MYNTHLTNTCIPIPTPIMYPLFPPLSCIPYSTPTTTLDHINLAYCMAVQYIYCTIYYAKLEK